MPIAFGGLSPVEELREDNVAARTKLDSRWDQESTAWFPRKDEHRHEHPKGEDHGQIRSKPRHPSLGCLGSDHTWPPPKSAPRSCAVEFQEPGLLRGRGRPSEWRPVQRSREANVGDFRTFFLRHQNVPGGQVSVYYVERMEIRHGCRDIAKQAELLKKRKRRPG